MSPTFNMLGSNGHTNSHNFHLNEILDMRPTKHLPWSISYTMFTIYWSNISYIGKGKPSGLNAARKLRTHRRENRWADKQFKKRLLGTAFKSSPFGGSSHAKGIVLEKMYVKIWDLRWQQTTMT